MTELTVLQVVRLKGRASPADLAATLGEELAEVMRTVEQLTASGLLIEDTALRISPRGRARLHALLAQEREGADPAALAAAYNDFRSATTNFNALVTDWQLKGDSAVSARLEGVHEQVVPIIAAAATQLPRLSTYQAKLRTALDKVMAGEIAWLTRPLIDSYRTVWFELHEELILGVGLTRDVPARSDDAQ